MTTQIKAGVIAANAVNSSELASGALSGQNFTGDVAFDTTTLKIDSSNNRVGIGTTSPTADLSVGSTSTSSGDVHLRTTKTAFSITPSNTDAGGILFDLGWVNGGQGPMKFGINGSEKMRIDSSGNLIMTAGGTIRAGGVNDLILDAGESGTPDIYLQSGGATKVKIEGSNGNVGIGTTSPLEKLDVRDYTGIAINSNYCHVGSTVSGAMAIFGHNIKSDSGTNIIKSANTGYHSSMIKMYYNEGITFHATSGTATAGDTFYDISGTTNELMRITNSGNVGIGTSSPFSTARLQVKTGTNLNLAVQTGTTITNGMKINAFNDAGSANIPLEINGSVMLLKTGETEKMRIDSSGKVAIGSTTANSGYSASHLLTFQRIDDDPIQIRAGTTGQGQPSEGTGISWTWSDSSTNAATWAAIRAIFPGNSDTHLTFSTKPTGSGGSVTERMRIDSSGNVGVGTTDPQNSLHINATGDSRIQFTNTTSGTGYGDGTWIGIDNTQAYFLNRENTPITFWTNTTERMRIDTSGNLIVGKTAANLTLGGLYVSNNDFMAYTNTSTDTGDRCLILNRQNGTGELVDFRYQNSSVGKITHNGSQTSYGIGSDYRLKENVEYDFTALDRVAQLKPARFNFIADADTTVDGFIAHEVQDIVPEAVTGEKDAVDDEGNPVMQGIDQSKLVPLLTKAIQEQQTIIDDLKSRITKLEG